MEEKANQVTNFMYYMFNRWSECEAIHIFGSDLGKHIYGKWLQCRSYGVSDLLWYSELDNKCREKLVARADEIYTS